MEKVKTYMLRLYPEKAADSILINYLSTQRNVQQFIRQLIEKDLEGKKIEQTIREIMEEYLKSCGNDYQPQESADVQNVLPEEATDNTEADVTDIDEITPDALEFLKMFESE